MSTRPPPSILGRLELVEQGFDQGVARQGIQTSVGSSGPDPAILGGLRILAVEGRDHRREPSEADVRRAANRYRQHYCDDAFRVIGDQMLAARFAPDGRHRRFLKRVSTDLLVAPISHEGRILGIGRLRKYSPPRMDFTLAISRHPSNSHAYRSPLALKIIGTRLLLPFSSHTSSARSPKYYAPAPQKEVSQKPASHFRSNKTALLKEQFA